MTYAFLWLIARIVPARARARWLEEWRAELAHGRWTMVFGALPDARALRRLPPEPGRRRTGIFHALDQDVRYALRGFGSGKSFTLAVIGSLAIGIGATTTAFALVNSAFFRPMPGVHAQEELVRVTLGWRNPGAWIRTVWDDHQVLQTGIPALEDMLVAHDTRFALAPGAGQEPRTAGGLVVSANYFTVLGVRPALGRFFLPDDDGTAWARPAVIVSHSYWQRYLGGDAAVLQRTLSVNGAPLPIIGVAPEGFAGIFASGDVQVWITFALSDLAFQDANGLPIRARDAPPFATTLIGRLKPSSTIEQARAQAAGLAQPLMQARDRGMKQLFVHVQRLGITDAATEGLRALALMIVPLMVLAIACVNAANLLLARATRRSQEWLVRLALGASRWRLVRQLLVESLLLALAGASVGLVLCFWTAGFVQRLAPVAVVFDGNVVGFVVGAAFVTSLVFGLGPALSVTRSRVSRAPEAGRFLRGPFGSRTRTVLVTLQAALCLGLLATGAQFTKTLQAQWEDGLAEPEQFLSVSLDLSQLRYGRAETEAFYRQLLARVGELPGVTAAALTDRSASTMLGGFIMDWGPTVRIPGVAEAPSGLVTSYATGDVFEAMNLALQQGRTFTAEDQRAPARTVVVNEEFARRAFGGDAIGRVLTITDEREGADPAIAEAMIVGVVAAPESRPLFRLPMVFYPAPLTHEPALDLLVRFEGGAEGMAAAVRTIVSSLDSRLPIGRIATGEEHRRLRKAGDYMVAQTVSILGLLALALAAAGLYGVVSYMVTVRQKEIGIRMALGAAGGSVLRLIARQAIVPVLAGCVLGAAGAVIVGSLVRSRLYGVSPMDPVAFGGAALLLMLTMLVASLGPARRASRVDPITVLRRE